MRRVGVAGSALWVLLATFPIATASSSPGDPLFQYQWGLAAIHAPAAWGYSRGGGVKVAVIDNGVDFSNEDLLGKVVFTKGPRTQCFPTHQKCDISDVGRRSHATMVAGIIAARTGNGKGIAGVAPDASIISITYGIDWERDLAEGIRLAVDEGAQVVNMSFGQEVPRLVDEPVDQTPDGRFDVNLGGKYLAPALAYAWSKGAVLVAAAGNDSTPYCHFPASGPNVICVGATHPRDVKAPYSSFGYGLDIVGPGGMETALAPCDQLLSTPLIEGQIISTSVAGDVRCGFPGYRDGWGTSFAAPHVAGVAALLISKGLENTQVVDCLYRTADDLGAPGYDPIYGHGLVNAYRAVRNCHR